MKRLFCVIVLFSGFFSFSALSARNSENQSSPDQGWQDLTVKLVSLVNINCSDQRNGEIDVIIFGGKKPYHIHWKKNGEPFSHAEDLTQLESGIYEITVEDSRGKSVTKSYTITAPKELRFQDSVRSPSCSSEIRTGTIILKAQGGLPPYRYEVYKDGEKIISTSNNRFPNLILGRYDITLIDALGCRSARSVVLECR